jgi:hypothetical protein
VVKSENIFAIFMLNLSENLAREQIAGISALTAHLFELANRTVMFGTVDSTLTWQTQEFVPGRFSYPGAGKAILRLSGRSTDDKILSVHGIKSIAHPFKTVFHSFIIDPETNNRFELPNSTDFLRPGITTCLLAISLAAQVGNYTRGCILNNRLFEVICSSVPGQVFSQEPLNIQSGLPVSSFAPVH